MQNVSSTKRFPPPILFSLFFPTGFPYCAYLIKPRAFFFSAKRTDQYQSQRQTLATVKLFFLFILVPFISTAQDPLPEGVYLGQYLEFAIDSLDCQSQECLESLEWFKVDEDVPILQSTQHKIWVNLPPTNRDGIFSIKNWMCTPAKAACLGSEFEMWEIPSGQYHVEIKTGTRNLLQIACVGPNLFPITFPTEEQQDQVKFQHHKLSSLVIGGFAILILYSMFLLTRFRRIEYFVYLGFILSVGGTQLIPFGFYQTTLELEGAEFTVLSGVFIPITSFFCIALSIAFLKPWNQATQKRILIAVAVISSIISLASLFGQSPSSYHIANAYAGSCAIFVLAVAIGCTLRRKFKPLMFLFLWLVFITGTVAFILTDFGLIPYSKNVRLIMPFGSLIASLILSGLVSNQIANIQKAETTAANALTDIKQQIEVRHLRAKHSLLSGQMGPHFIFNALGTIKSFIICNDKSNSMKSVDSFASLTRAVLEHCRMDEISLLDEFQFLEDYLEFERFQSAVHFTYDFTVDPDLIPEEVMIPPLLLQPIVENALKHGIRAQRAVQGQIKIRVRKIENGFCVTIQDNGIGINNPKIIKRKGHQSKALTIIQERISILETQGKMSVTVNTIDLISEGAQGTKVIFNFIILKPNSHV